jgi:hypothetical protein
MSKSGMEKILDLVWEHAREDQGILGALCTAISNDNDGMGPDFSHTLEHEKPDTWRYRLIDGSNYSIHEVKWEYELIREVEILLQYDPSMKVGVIVDEKEKT